jgi:mannose/cellobiose epimerase-like protein (N-acyl-D-glucosamine 2-epimerase family)
MNRINYFYHPACINPVGGFFKTFRDDGGYGGWYRVLAANGTRREAIKSLPAKTDYHPFCACNSVLRLLTEAAP